MCTCPTGSTQLDAFHDMDCTISLFIYTQVHLLITFCCLCLQHHFLGNAASLAQHLAHLLYTGCSKGCPWCLLSQQQTLLCRKICCGSCSLGRQGAKTLQLHTQCLSSQACRPISSQLHTCSSLTEHGLLMVASCSTPSFR